MPVSSNKRRHLYQSLMIFYVAQKSFWFRLRVTFVLGAGKRTAERKCVHARSTLALIHSLHKFTVMYTATACLLPTSAKPFCTLDVAVEGGPLDFRTPGAASGVRNIQVRYMRGKWLALIAWYSYVHGMAATATCACTPATNTFSS